MVRWATSAGSSRVIRARAAARRALSTGPEERAHQRPEALGQGRGVVVPGQHADLRRPHPVEGDAQAVEHRPPGPAVVDGVGAAVEQEAVALVGAGPAGGRRALDEGDGGTRPGRGGRGGESGEPGPDDDDVDQSCSVVARGRARGDRNSRCAAGLWSWSGTSSPDSTTQPPGS